MATRDRRMTEDFSDHEDYKNEANPNGLFTRHYWPAGIVLQSAHQIVIKCVAGFEVSKFSKNIAGLSQTDSSKEGHRR
jgi:hypothetical protein